jgi:hypothetical protein
MESLMSLTMGNNSDMDMNMTMTMTSTERMEMTFYNDHNFKLYFDSWDFDTHTKYSGGIVAFICISFAVEMLAFFSQLTARWARRAITPTEKLWWGVTAGLVYGNVMLSFLMMLAVMTYSTGVFFAVVTGISLGYCVFHIILGQSAPEARVDCGKENVPFGHYRT